MRIQQPPEVRVQLAGSPTQCTAMRLALHGGPFDVLHHDVTNATVLAEAVGEAHPMVLLLDATMPDSIIPHTLDELAQLPAVPRLLVTAPKYTPYLKLARNHPLTRGTLLHKLARSPLLKAVVTGIANGSTYFQPLPRKSGLTDYQYQLLCLMAVGMDPQQLIQATGRSLHSIYSAQNTMRGKLGVETNEQAIVEAVRLGLVAMLTSPENQTGMAASA